MSTSANDSIVLTGCGWVTPLAAGTIDNTLAAARGDRGESVPAHGYWAVADELVSEYPDLSAELKRDRGAWMTGIAFHLARRNASLAADALPPERVGLALGCAEAGQLGMIGFANEVRKQTPRFVSPIHFPQTVGNYIAGALARGFNLRGPNVTLASGTASGLDALLEASAQLKTGAADVFFAGGTAQLSDDLVKGSDETAGILSEGACLFVLERAAAAAARGVAPLATITGYRRSPVDEAFEPGDDPSIVSCAGCCHAGAVLIEHWLGHSGGAAGPAALAAAIAAADGQPLPILEAAERTAVSVKPVAIDTMKADGRLKAIVCADADGSHMTILELVIPV